MLQKLEDYWCRQSINLDWTGRPESVLLVVPARRGGNRCHAKGRAGRAAAVAE
jgi:hypothetical protein